MVPLQSVPITTKVESSNPAHGKVHSIQHNVIKFVSDLRQDRLVVFSGSSCFLHQNKTWPSKYNWNIVEGGDKHHSHNRNSRQQFQRYWKYWVAVNSNLLWCLGGNVISKCLI